jgi:hypothetical protein
VKTALVLAALVAIARAEPPKGERVAYIATVIDALRASDPAALVNATKYVDVVARNKCLASEQSLRINCLIAAAALGCPAGPDHDRCTRVSDVIVTNRLSVDYFVPKDVRYDIMNKHKDYRSEVARELRRRYAMLVAELVMSRHFPGSRADSRALATGIDAYCAGAAGTRGLSWQYCVAAIAWFVGTDGGTPKEKP